MASSGDRAFGKVRQQIVSVGTTATKLPLLALESRSSAIIQNLSTNAIYIGSASVTTTGATRGIVLPNQYDSVTIDISDSLDIYGIAGSTSDVAVLEIF